MPPTPLLGYNNNVRHRRRIFHIQTEDSGVGSPRIMTHLFADGGRIVKSTRTDYSEFLEHDDLAAVVKNLMKEQHKAMFVALRSGALDELIGFEDEGVVPEAPQTMASAQLASDALTSQSAATIVVQAAGQPARSSKRAPTSPPTSSAGAPKLAASLKRAGSADERGSDAEEQGEINTKEETDPEQGEAPQAPGVNSYAPSRPAAIFSVPPPNLTNNIFGQVGLDEKSLDDTILSYLAEEPPVKKKTEDK